MGNFNPNIRLTYVKVAYVGPIKSCIDNGSSLHNVDIFQSMHGNGHGRNHGVVDRLFGTSFERMMLFIIQHLLDNS